MSIKQRLIPEYGPFSDMRVLSSGSLIAMPYAATLLADFGAEVIHIERPGAGDTLRSLGPFACSGDKRVSTAWAQNGRNKLSFTLELDLSILEVRDVFFGLIKASDVYMENIVWLEKFGISDETLLELNPRLIIAHVSGYGSHSAGGLSEYCERASYDMIGQAFSGWLNLNGPADGEPSAAKPYLNDYVSALVAAFGVLAAYHSALRTGRGQVVDVAQFEAQGMLMCDGYTVYTMLGENRERSGNRSSAFQPYDLYTSSDGLRVALGAFGPSVFKRFIVGVGFDGEYYNYDDCSSGPDKLLSPKGREFSEAVKKWCLEHTADEIEAALAEARVPCSRINTAKDCFENPHFQSRGDWISYEDQSIGREVTAFGIAPKLSETPGAVWRGAPALGQDTNMILQELLGYDQERINVLRERKLI